MWCPAYTVLGKGSEVCLRAMGDGAGRIQEGFLEEVIWSSVLKEKLRLTRQRREERVLEFNDLLNDLVDLKRQS